MLSLHPTVKSRPRIRFPDFAWLDDMPVDDWSGHFQGQHSLDFTLRELSLRGGMESCEGVLDAFRAWAFAHSGRRYAILWTGEREPEDTVMIVLLDSQWRRHKVAARDPLAEGWMM